MLSHLHFLISLLIATSHAVDPEIGVPICAASKGPNINLGHCEYIYRNRLHNAQDTNFHSRPSPSNQHDNANAAFSHAMSYIFSPTATDPGMRLPAYFRRRNCFLVIGAEDTSLRVTGLWADLQAEVAKLVNACVRDKNGQGGRLQLASGLYLEVWKPASYVAMVVDTRRDIPGCLTTAVSKASLGRNTLGQYLR